MRRNSSFPPPFHLVRTLPRDGKDRRGGTLPLPSSPPAGVELEGKGKASPLSFPTSYTPWGE